LFTPNAFLHRGGESPPQGGAYLGGCRGTLPLSPALREKVRFSLLLTIKNIIDKFNVFHKFLIQA
jgi:hypothetical protein